MKHLAIFALAVVVSWKFVMIGANNREYLVKDRLTSEECISIWVYGFKNSAAYACRPEVQF